MYPDFTDEAIHRFWTKVEKTDTCWLWRGTVTNWGYGLFHAGAHGTRRMFTAHRVSYELAHGHIPDDLVACHSCDVKICVNPAHLWLGTQAENMLDMKHKQRGAIGDLNGSRLHPERLRRGSNSFPARNPELYRGEANKTSKITEIQVRTIRQMYADGGWTTKALAAKFGLGPSQVKRIIRRTAWAHVN